MHRRCRNQWRRLAAGGLAALCAGLTLTGCEGDDQPSSGSSSVEAFPEPPHAAGPIEVALRPALPAMTGDRRCRPEQDEGLLCSSDGSGGYRALGDSGPVVVDEVSTAPSADRTSWGWEARFAADSRAAARRARDEAAALGGVVVVTVDDTVLVVLEPADLSARGAVVLGLQKAEAWTIVESFSRSKQGM